MTKQECAIVMAHTGICMLTGKDFSIFHKYVGNIMGRPVFTHEMGTGAIADEIKEKSKADFLRLCENALEQTQPQDGDLISRQDAIAKIYEDFMTIDMAVHDKSAQRCMDILSKLPSVSQKNLEGGTSEWEQ